MVPDPTHFKTLMIVGSGTFFTRDKIINDHNCETEDHHKIQENQKTSELMRLRMFHNSF